MAQLEARLEREAGEAVRLLEERDSARAEIALLRAPAHPDAGWSERRIAELEMLARHQAVMIRELIDILHPYRDFATDADFAPCPGWRSPVEPVRRGRIHAGPMDGRAIAELLTGGE